jgi:hypothetical protein
LACGTVEVPVGTVATAGLTAAATDVAAESTIVFAAGAGVAAVAGATGRAVAAGAAGRVGTEAAGDAACVTDRTVSVTVDGTPAAGGTGSLG